MPDIIKYLGFTCLLSSLAFFPASSGFAAMDTYHKTPPFISSAVLPNVVLVMDFSGSMQSSAYYGSLTDGYYYSRVLDDWDYYEAFSYDGWNGNGAGYDSSSTYYGYFDSEKYYEYVTPVSGKGYWQADEDSTYAGTQQVGDASSLSGNFLNFIVMSRTDVALKSLIGGKAVQDGDYYILTPQGSERWVRVDDPKVDCYVRPEDPANGDYADKDIMISIYGHWYQDRRGNWYQENSPDIAFTNRYARVRIPEDERQGIVQQNENKVRFHLINYASSANYTAREGIIKYGAYQENIDQLVDALERTVPYQGTYSGQALRQAYYYLRQDLSNVYNYNTDYIYQDRTDTDREKDPYYKQKDDGTFGEAWCRRSFVVLISDGVWCEGSNCDSYYDDPDLWASKLHTEDLRQETGFEGVQNADIYSLFTFSEDPQGIRSMKTVAAFGGFEDIEGCGKDATPYGLNVRDDSRYDVSYPLSNCDSGCSKEWDSSGNCDAPDNFFYATQGAEMAQALTQIFSEIRQGTSSGTAVTALTSRATSGAVVTQAVFYSQKEFADNKTLAWTGNVLSEWFLNAYVEGNLVQNMREDTNGDFILDVYNQQGGDRIIEYKTENNSIRVDAYESADDGTKADTTVDEIYWQLEDVANLLNCGEKLKNREPINRTIYGVSESDTLVSFDDGHYTDFDALMGDPDDTDDNDPFPACIKNHSTPYKALINYVRGEDIINCRSRATGNTSSENVWKLGDIISSSPTAVNYGDYRMVYVGANDGMLHAFRMGYINNRGQKLHPTELCDSRENTSPCTHNKLGKEEWAFIPKDSMPYLRYLADPEYKHIYTVDLKPYIISTADQTILIGGMRFGGAPGNPNVPLNPPTDISDDDPTVGRSAYFALDITDPEDPKYLWRFAPQGMGFTYSGPAYVKRRDSDTDYHYIIFASGPTRYNGTSTQPLKIYVVNLETGVKVRTFEMMNNAFGGRLFTDGLDLNDDQQTDFVFLGYTNDPSGKGELPKLNGGIIKIYTGSSNVDNWECTTFLSSSIGNPVTAPVKVSDCFPRTMDYPYLYFGSGHYFVSNDKTQDGTNDRNYLYGVPFTCDINNENCSQISNIDNSSELTCDDVLYKNGPNSAAWKIPLDLSSGEYLRERLYSNFSITNQNIVFFDTAKPTDEVCACGGKSRSWALNCATGRGLLTDICGDGVYTIDPDLTFQFLLQLSGGDIKQTGRTDFDETGSGATAMSSGLPGPGGTPLFPAGAFDLDYWKQW